MNSRIYLKDELTEEEVQFTLDWISALRSGEYEQGKRALCDLSTEDSTKYCYCCLGVACDISPRYEQVEVPDQTYRSFKALAMEQVLQHEKVGSLADYDTLVLKDAEGDPSDAGYYSLVTLNDDFDATFEQIANLLEKDLNRELDLDTYRKILDIAIGTVRNT